MRYAFWNANGKSNNEYISSLVMDNGVDTLILSEYKRLNISELIERLGFDVIPSAGCEEIIILGDSNAFEMCTQEKRFSIQIVNNDYLLCGLHLTSKLFDSCGDRRLIEIEQILSDISEIQNQRGITEVVFVGDFNDDPFEKSIINVQAFHALPSIRDLEKEYRQIENKAFRRYYNPMWNLLGDNDGVPGTYYYANSPNPSESFWHMLDQVIISKGLYDRFIFNQLRIVTETSRGPLTNHNGHPNEKISDHFPIIFEIGGN